MLRLLVLLLRRSGPLLGLALLLAVVLDLLGH